VFQDRPCIHIVCLNSICDSWHDCLTLPCQTTTSHINVDVKQTCVLGDCEWHQDCLSLIWRQEILQKWPPINCDLTISSLDVCHSDCVLTFSRAPSLTLGVELGLALLERQTAAEIEQVQTIKLHLVIRVDFVVLTRRKRQSSLVTLFSLLRKVRTQMMLVEWIILKAVEQADFKILIWGQ